MERELKELRENNEMKEESLKLLKSKLRSKSKYVFSRKFNCFYGILCAKDI